MRGEKEMLQLRIGSTSLRVAAALLATCTLTLFASPVEAMDGLSMAGPTYYQDVLGPQPPEALASAAPGLPTRLYISESSAKVTYDSVPGDDSIDWLIRVRDLTRNHERIDTFYLMIAVLPMPVDEDGLPAFETKSRGIVPREGTEQASVPLIYGGEKVVLKRAVILEKTLLPGLIGSKPDVLPSLAGTGYGYTLWQTLIRYDSSYGDTVQVFADVPYSTDVDVAPPDASDERLKAYVITWIPQLDASLPPFAIRMDIAPPAPPE
jgi:hypothetical protein